MSEPMTTPIPGLRCYYCKSPVMHCAGSFFHAGPVPDLRTIVREVEEFEEVAKSDDEKDKEVEKILKRDKEDIDKEVDKAIPKQDKPNQN